MVIRRFSAIDRDMLRHCAGEEKASQGKMTHIARYGCLPLIFYATILSITSCNIPAKVQDRVSKNDKPAELVDKIDFEYQVITASIKDDILDISLSVKNITAKYVLMGTGATFEMIVLRQIMLIDYNNRINWRVLAPVPGDVFDVRFVAIKPGASGIISVAAPLNSIVLTSKSGMKISGHQLQEFINYSTNIVTCKVMSQQYLVDPGALPSGQESDVFLFGTMVFGSYGELAINSFDVESAEIRLAVK